MNYPRIYLSRPHLMGEEERMVLDALRSGWVAPLGPHVDAFEAEMGERLGGLHAAALSSGTAAIHLALRLLGVGAGDYVIVSSLTFAGSIFPIRYVGANPVFIDSERESWNLDPALTIEAMDTLIAEGCKPAAVMVVHLYGQSADLQPIMEACRERGIPLIEDAAEALGTTYRGLPAGSFGDIAAFSFNGNKIITTSGGGMLVSRDAELVDHARRLAAQAREPVVHYEHQEVGYNYRLSNLLAALGRAQLATLEQRVEARRRVHDRYRSELGGLAGLLFMPEAEWGRHTRWLTTLTIDPERFGLDREQVRLALEEVNVEARPVWKPMHAQPLFAGYRTFGGAVSESLFAHGLCLPSGSDLTDDDLTRIVEVVRGLAPSTFPEDKEARST